MIGHEHLEERFKKLVKSNGLNHAYLFFGPPQVGKHSFALSFANFLENGSFEKPVKFLNECLVVAPVIEETKESIGIDAVRGFKKFLYELPVNSDYRVGIIDNAEYLTTDAQNALLKIAEEPPAHALLIINASNPNVLIRPLQSRLQKIYFSSVKKADIAKMLIAEHGLIKDKASEIAALSFGSPGFAIDLISNPEIIAMKKEVEMLIKNPSGWKKAVGGLVNIENKAKIEPFLKVLLATLAVNPKENYGELGSITNRLTMMKDWNTNKKIQLEAIKLI